MPPRSRCRSRLAGAAAAAAGFGGAGLAPAPGASTPGIAFDSPQGSTSTTPRPGFRSESSSTAAVQLGHGLHQAQAQADARACRGWHRRDRSARPPWLFGVRGCPGPSSATGLPPWRPQRRRTATSIEPFSGAYFSALSIRLPSACASSTGSPEHRQRAVARESAEWMCLSSAAGA